MPHLRTVIAASAVACASAFAPLSALPSVQRRAAASPLTVVANGNGTGRYLDVGIRGAPIGKAGLPPVEPDPLSIDLELVQGKRGDDVVDTTYRKPPSSFFSSGAAPVPAAKKPTASAPKPYARAYGAKEWDEARRQGSFGADGKPAALAAADIAVGAKVGAQRNRRQGSFLANIFKRK